MGDNDPIQPQSAVSQDQNKKRPFGCWRIAAVAVPIIIAVIGGLFYLHWSSTYPTLYASYSGGVAPFACSPPDAMSWTGTLTLTDVVEDHTHGTFTGLISESDGCGYCNGAAHGSVTPSGSVRFTYVLGSDNPLGCGNNVSFSGMIQSQKSVFTPDGEIDGQMYYYGTYWASNFGIAPSSP